MSAERDQKLYDGMVELIKKDIPGFSVDYKDTTKDWKIRAAAKIVGIFNKQFMTGYTTTLYPKVYFPNRKQVEDHPYAAARTLAHEYVHLYDRYSKGFMFTASYLSPQLYALFGLLSFFALSAIWNPLGFLFLVFLPLFALVGPWASPGRTNWEIRGYTVNFAIRLWDAGQITGEYRERVKSKFTGMDYYRMCPSEEKVDKLLDERLQLIDSEELFEEEGSRPYQAIHVLWTTHPKE